MALFLRKTAHNRLDIQGYTPAEWRMRRKRREEARKAVRQRLGQAIRFPSFTSSSSSSSSTGLGDSVRFTAGNDVATLEISSSKHFIKEDFNQVVSVEVMPP